MQDFEKLGVFYLGKRCDAGGAPTDDPVLYDSKDLTTHAVIIGMTGSGKTGLGIALIEEAAIDHVPVIAIDPKGDLGNLLLAFPDLKGADFEPWVDARAAAEAGQSAADYAEAQATTWRKGLADWGQDAARIGRLRAARISRSTRRAAPPGCRSRCSRSSRRRRWSSPRTRISTASASRGR